MSAMIDKFLETLNERKLANAIERQASALERIATSLEALLPSPLTTPGFQNNNLKPASASSYRVYGDKEAYWDEIKKKRQEATEATEDE